MLVIFESNGSNLAIETEMIVALEPVNGAQSRIIAQGGQKIVVVDTPFVELVNEVNKYNYRGA